MRKEPFTVGSIVHVVKRGARGLPVVRDESDRWRFLKLLYFLNDYNRPEYWERDVDSIRSTLHFERPQGWEERSPMVNILSYVLMENHFHLLLEEINEGGVSKFVQSLAGSMSVHFNRKYDERGSLFQGSYRSKTVNTDEYFDIVHRYINIKNPFELYEGGLSNAIENFDKAFDWASNYPFCSLADFVGKRDRSPILFVKDQYDYDPSDYRGESRIFLEYKLDQIKVYE